MVQAYAASSCRYSSGCMRQWISSVPAYHLGRWPDHSPQSAQSVPRSHRATKVFRRSVGELGGEGGEGPVVELAVLARPSSHTPSCAFGHKRVSKVKYIKRFIFMYFSRCTNLPGLRNFCSTQHAGCALLVWDELLLVWFIPPSNMCLYILVVASGLDYPGPAPDSLLNEIYYCYSMRMVASQLLGGQTQPNLRLSACFACNHVTCQEQCRQNKNDNAYQNTQQFRVCD
jgi:hypothetical protein